jgi:large subunit ribosomal protein L4
MPEVALYDRQGEKIGQVQLADDVFGAEVNVGLLHQAVVAIERGMQQFPARAQTRSEVDMARAKWYRQKGTGRARHGAQSAPIFVGGGQAHGPTGPRRKPKLSRKMRRKALNAALSAQVADGAVIVVDEVTAEEYSTKRFVEMLNGLGATGRTLMLLGSDEARNEKVYRSGRNIPKLIMRESPHVNARDILYAHTIIISQAGLAALSEGVEASA